MVGKGLAAVAAVATLALAACGGGGVPPDADGPEIYRAVCARCHGGDLRGDQGPPLVGEGAVSAGRPETYFTQAVSSGIGRMPAFRRTLTEEQILLVSRYVIHRQSETPPDPAP